MIFLYYLPSYLFFFLWSFLLQADSSEKISPQYYPNCKQQLAKNGLSLRIRTKDKKLNNITMPKNILTKHNLTKR